MSTGVTAVFTTFSRSEPETCHHAFISDNYGFSVCHYCGLVDGENLAVDSRLLLMPYHSPLQSSHPGPATCIGRNFERKGSYIWLDQLNNHQTYSRNPIIRKQFHRYLAQMDLSISLDVCMGEYSAIAEDIPLGTTRQAPILCAVLLILHLRSQQGRSMEIYPYLKTWGITLKEYNTGVQILSKIPRIHAWMKKMERTGPPFLQQLHEKLHSLQHQLTLSPILIEDAFHIAKRFRLPNRLNIQAAVTVLAAHERHPDIGFVEDQEIITACHHVSAEQVHAVKRTLLKRISFHKQSNALSQKACKDATLDRTSPKIGDQSLSKQRFQLRWLTAVLLWETESHLGFSPIGLFFSIQSSSSDFYFTGKQIMIRQGFFPPPIGVCI